MFFLSRLPGAHVTVTDLNDRCQGHVSVCSPPRMPDKHEADKAKMLKNQMKEFSSTSNLKKAKPGKRKGKKKKGRGIKK